MTPKSFFPILGLVLRVFAAQAQPGTCGNYPPVSVQSDGEEAFNDYVRRFVAAGNHLNTDLKTIPTVVHVFYDNPADSLPLARVAGAVGAMSQCFRRQNADTAKTRPVFKLLAADCQVEFCLASLDPQGQETPGVVWHKTPGFVEDSLFSLMKQTQWPPLRYLNIWVKPNGEGGNSSLPWEVGSETDGFWAGAKWFGTSGANLHPGFAEGGVATHEAGHYLGLWHTFHNSTQYSFECDFPPCDSTGDYVCDTPLDWELAWSAEQCPDGLRHCTDGSNYLTMSENFMAYAYDTCTSLFTNGQRIRIRAALDSLRAELCSPANLIATGCQPSVGMDEPNSAFSEADVLVSPNPASNFLDLKFLKNTPPEGQLSLFDGQGRAVFQGKIDPASGQLRLELPSLPGGIYLLKIRGGSGFWVKKVVLD